MDEVRSVGKENRPDALQRLRAWLRRKMPLEALASVILFLLWISIHRTRFYEGHEPFVLFGLLTFFAIFAASAYYGLKGLRWLKRRLLWRVRRRLLITYLFVGATPIILLGLLGALAWSAFSTQAMSRVLMTQLTATENSVLGIDQAVADEFSRQPRMDDRVTKQWLDEKTSFLQTQFPGAQLALIRIAVEGQPWSQSKSAITVSAPVMTVETRPFGADQVDETELLPKWLSGREKWSGIAFLRPRADVETVFGEASFRAMVKGTANGSNFAMVLIYPVNPSFIQKLDQTTGLSVRPFFVAIDAGKRLKFGSRTREIDSSSGDEVQLPLDQAGEAIDQTVFPIIVRSTNWVTGTQDERVAFFFAWSWSAAEKLLLQGGRINDIFQKLLIICGVIFLILELMALLSAAWIIRAVTGTVHKLYMATGFMKRGDFSHRVTVKSHDQLGELAESFNEMSSNIESLLHERVERERLQREVEIAAEVQSQLFPREIPPLRCVELSAECRAARVVAGDYYDYVEICPGVAVLALGDVSGKGISASLVMSNLQASLRAQSSMIADRIKISSANAVVATAFGNPDTVPGPVMPAMTSGATAGLGIKDSANMVERIAANINHQLCQSTSSNRFVTLFLGLYNDQTRTLHYTNAGHNAPILVRDDGVVERLTVGGMIVGAFDTATYEQAAVQINQGDTLVIFSDGLSEAERVTGEEYGEERLVEFVVANRDLSAEGLCHAIFAEIEHWSASDECADDQTLMIVKGLES